ERYGRGAAHWPMPPVLPTESIAHLGTADCCIHPPGRNEMIASPPPKIFSKEVAQNRPPHLPRQQSPSPPEIVLRQISGDEAWMKIRNQKVPPPGVPYRGSAARQNEVSLAARVAMLRARSGASILHCDRDALHAAASPFTTVQKKCISYTVEHAQARFSRMKSTSKKRTPSIVNLTVKRPYLTEREV